MFQILTIAKIRNITLPEIPSDTTQVPVQKELTIFDKVKDLITVYFKNQPLGLLQPFMTAISEQELKSAWENWVPCTAREHEFTQELQNISSDVFATKIIAEQMTYENLPDWYQELTQEEQRRQQNHHSATAAIGFFQPPPPPNSDN